MTGGAFGTGISRNIKACYRFLVESFTPGDELYFFGFSRGAYTVRSLAGLVRNAGILRREHVGRVDEAYDLYRDRDDEARPKSAKAVAFRERLREPRPRSTSSASGTRSARWASRHAGRWGGSRASATAFTTCGLSQPRPERLPRARRRRAPRRPFEPTLWEVRADDPACSRPALARRAAVVRRRSLERRRRLPERGAVEPRPALDPPVGRGDRARARPGLHAHARPGVRLRRRSCTTR